MKKLHLLLGLGFAALLALSSCSSDEISKDTENPTSQNSITNGDITVNYGETELNKAINLINSPVQFTKLAQNKGAINASSAKASNYTPNLTGAIAATGSNWYNINNSETYYIPEGTTFTGGFNFNSAGKIIVLGTMGGSNNLNVPNNGTVDVGNAGVIASSVGFNLNSGGKLNNYGIANYKQNAVSGTINNYNELIFNNNISLNSSSTVNNNCKMTFVGNTNYLNASVNNSGTLVFMRGFHINSSGVLNLIPGSLTEVKGGSISVDGKIRNSASGFARFDVSNASFGNMNASPAVVGFIDMNFTNTNYSIFTGNSNKKDANVTLNANTYIVGNECVAQKGTQPCNNDQLSFNLVANVQSPVINGKTLSATDVKVNGNYAYVSYHTNDEMYDNSPFGAVRIINISDYINPSMASEATFLNAEFNGIDVSNNTLYAVGGNKNGARLVTTPLTNGLFNTSDLSVFKQFSLPSATAKNSFFYNNFLWVVSGATNGGYFKLDPNNNYSVSEQLYSNGQRAKYIARNNTYQVFFAVETTGAFLRIADLNGANVRTYNYSSLAQNVTNGKNGITLDNDYAYIALSDKGVAKIKLSDGTLANHFVPSNFTQNGQNVFSGGLTNSVAINDCYLYLANGGDGVIVMNKNTFSVVGYYHISNGTSANFVYVNNGVIFVGNGVGGLSILKKN